MCGRGLASAVKKPSKRSEHARANTDNLRHCPSGTLPANGSRVAKVVSRAFAQETPPGSEQVVNIRDDRMNW